MPLSVGGKIKACREERGWTQQQLADHLSSPAGKRLTRASVAQWELGQTHPRHNILLQLGALFNRSPSYFQRFGGDTVVPSPNGPDDNSSKRSILLLTWSEFARWRKVGEEAMLKELKRPTYVEIRKPLTNKGGVAFTLQDDSMEPEFFVEEEICIDRGLEPTDHDYVVAELGTGELLFRQYRRRGPNSYDLVACNPDWHTESVTPRRPAQILGVMIQHLRKRRAR